MGGRRGTEGPQATDGAPSRPQAHDARRLSRELAMRAIFARDVGLARPLEVLAHWGEEEGVPAPVQSLARALVEGVFSHLGEVDGRIATYSRHWSLPRLAAVDRSVLRLAIFELLYRPEVPRAVVVDEAVGLADAFGGEDSARFVNGILGQFVRDLEAGTPRD
jgi:N utilization substance protein B